MSEKYKDMLDLPHHVSRKRPQMSMENRAAQFSPFAAVVGHDAAIKETARLTDRKIELDEDEKQMLDESLARLQQLLDLLPATWETGVRQEISYPKAQITYFIEDEKKQGGSYVTRTESIRKIDSYTKRLLLENHTEIPLDNILEIHFPNN